jgi:hypothetical protein
MGVKLRLNTYGLDVLALRGFRWHFQVCFCRLLSLFPDVDRGGPRRRCGDEVYTQLLPKVTEVSSI